GNLGSRRLPIAIAGGRLTRETTGERRQIHVLSEVAGGKSGSVEPVVQESPGRPGEVVALAVGDRPRRLSDQQHSGFVNQAGPYRVGVLEVPRNLTRPTCNDVVREGLEGRRLTLV